MRSIMLGPTLDQGEAVRYGKTGTGRNEVTLLDGKKPFFLKFVYDLLLFGNEIEVIALW